MKLLAGVKGTGKTKALIAEVNKVCGESNGSIVFIEKGKKSTFDVNYQARLVDADEYCIANGDALYGFVCGILAANYDITELFIDNTLALCENDVAKTEAFLVKANAVAAKYNVELMVSVSVEPEKLSDQVKAFLA